MLSFFDLRRNTWPLVAGASVLAVCAWGIYLWRFSDEAAPVVQTPVSAVGSEVANRGAGENHSPLMTPQDSPLVKDSGNERSVSANVPPADGQGIRITLPERGGVVNENGGDADGDPIVISTPSSTGVESGALRGSTDPRPNSDALAQARAALVRGELSVARVALSEALRQDTAGADRVWAEGELERIADVLLFSKARVGDDPLTGTHKIQQGDNLRELARRNKVTDALLARINGLRNPNIVPLGMNLKLIRGPFRAEISKSAHRMDVFVGNVMVRSYSVGLGVKGNTPTGVWRVKNKVSNPEWSDPSTGQHYLSGDPENPIGEHWIGLDGVSGEARGQTGFGIHGTIDAASIGRNESMGCIRLLSDDVTFLFDLLTEGESTVEVRP